MDLEQGSSSHLVIAMRFIQISSANSKNKTSLNKYLAIKFLAYHKGKQSILCVTFEDSIISNSEAVLSETDMNQYSSEKANPRIVFHVIKLGKKGYTNVKVKTVDSDVVILCLMYADIGIGSFHVKWTKI